MGTLKSLLAKLGPVSSKTLCLRFSTDVMHVPCMQYDPGLTVVTGPSTASHGARPKALCAAALILCSLAAWATLSTTGPSAQSTLAWMLPSTAVPPPVTVPSYSEWSMQVRSTPGMFLLSLAWLHEHTQRMAAAMAGMTVVRICRGRAEGE